MPSLPSINSNLAIVLKYYIKSDSKVLLCCKRFLYFFLNIVQNWILLAIENSFPDHLFPFEIVNKNKIVEEIENLKSSKATQENIPTKVETENADFVADSLHLSF